MTGHHTLTQSEQAVSARMAGLAVDSGAMAAVGNLYRAASVVRNHFERTVLSPHGLTWTAWVVLWVVWVWEEIETRHAASEAGISKSTLTGVVTTLQNRGLVDRRPYPADGRRVLLTLTPRGGELMQQLFPEVNRQEAGIVSILTLDEVDGLTEALNKIIRRLETSGTELDGPGSVSLED